MRLDVSSAKLLKEIDNFIDSHIWEWDVVPNTNNSSTTTIVDYEHNTYLQTPQTIIAGDYGYNGYNMYLHAPQSITAANHVATTTTDIGYYGYYYDSIRQAVQPMITQDLRQ